MNTGARKSWMLAVLLSLFLGPLGIDRFYLGYTGLGVLKLLTCGGFGLWWAIDAIMIFMNGRPDAEGRPLRI
jgi:TM2 domain-containing membrane protein YozV